MISKYDKLGTRFLKDYNLPFKYIDFNHFKYCLNLCGMLDKWTDLEILIQNKYKDNVEEFLQKEYYNIRNKIIEDLENNKDMKWFSQECNMQDFALPEEDRNIPDKDIYKENNIGKQFLSIDLKKANFQTLKAICSSIVKNASTYEEFIKKYSDLAYLAESKYTRQVIFGHLNPKRQITAEKWYINEIRKAIKDITDEADLKLVSMRSDELIFEIDKEKSIAEALPDLLQRYIKDITGFETSIEAFELEGYGFRNMEGFDKKFTFYVKKNLEDGKVTLKNIPIPYYKIVYKLYYNLPLEDDDYLIDFDGTMAELREEFEIIKIPF